MNYYSTNKIRKSLGNTTKDPKKKKQIIDFYSDSNIFNILKVEKVYFPKGTDEIHISQDDFEKINLFATLKMERGFKVKRVGMANPEIYKEMEEFTVSNIGDVRRAMSTKMKEVGGVRLSEKISITKTALKKMMVNTMPEDIEEKRIVSIDFEFSNKKDLITEMGMTVKQGDNMIPKHYLIDTAYKTKSDSSLQRRFRFGKTEIISLDTMTDIIKGQLELADYALFHSHQEDLRLFGIHGIWISDFKNLQIIDTQRLEGRQKPLQTMLHEYDIDHVKTEMHNSGNDAYYTIKLLEKMNNKKQPEMVDVVIPIIEHKNKPKMSLN